MTARVDAAPVTAAPELVPMRWVVAAAVAIGVLSTAFGPSAMGYDPWAWQVWSRELLSLDLATDGGPSWKPLPVLLVAPFALLPADLGPATWQVIAHASAVVALVLAYRVAARLAGVAAGLVAALGLAVSADFFVTALRAYSEPMLVALSLAAIDLHLAGRRSWALACLALGGLLRPEVWVFLGLYGIFALVTSTRGRERCAALALVVAAPVLWMGLDWLGSGNVLRSGEIARTSPLGSAVKAEQPALTVFERLADTVIAPVLVLAVVAVAIALRRRRRDVLALAAIVLLWTSVVAVMAEFGFTGRSRYLAVAAGILAVLGGTGFGLMLRAVARERWRQVVAVTAAVLLAGFAFVPARTDWRLLGLAREQGRQLDELHAAVARAGGPVAVRRAPAVAVNPYVQTALAWQIGTPLHDVRATWTQRTDPRRPAGGLLFRAPATLAGPVPLAGGAQVRLVARAGRWKVLALLPEE